VKRERVFAVNKEANNTPMLPQIQQQVRSFVIENFLFGDTRTGLQNTDLFIEQGIIDLTGVLELVAYLEETYGIKVEDEELIPENLNSIALVSDYVQRKHQQKCAA
jgi:acyl carrier protein